MSAHQATLDYVHQPLHTCSTEEEQRRRYEHTQFAEEQGRVTHQWLSLQETLSSQVRICRHLSFHILKSSTFRSNKSDLLLLFCVGVQIQEVEEELRSRTEQEARLQQISSWITDQNLWMDSAQTPSSRTELQRSVNTCQVRGHIWTLDQVTKHRKLHTPPQPAHSGFHLLALVVSQDLEEKIGQKSAALQEVRDKLDGGGGNNGCDFISQTENCIQNCAALKLQVNDTERTWRNEMFNGCRINTQCMQVVSVAGCMTTIDILYWKKLSHNIRQVYLPVCLCPPSVLYQNASVKQRLVQAQQLWDCVAKRLTQMMQKTARTSQTLDHHSSPQICLQAHRDLHERLQVARVYYSSSPMEFDGKNSNRSRKSPHTVCCVVSSFFTRRQKHRRPSGTS